MGGKSNDILIFHSFACCYTVQQDFSLEKQLISLLFISKTNALSGTFSNCAYL